MSPIDDELRAALHRRATAVPPSADPLAGIERRATRLQRNRLAASVAGSVLAVAAIATAVPLLSSTTSPAPDVPPVASAPPTLVPSPVPTTPSTPPTPAEPAYALDPADPWPYRGRPLEALGPGTVESLRTELAARRGVDPSSVALSPLYGDVDEPSGQVELVYVAQVDGQPRWGVGRSSESGPELVVEQPLADPATALLAALPGDEVVRLLVVASPEVTGVHFAPDDASEFTDLTLIADGVATGPLEGDPETDVVRVLGADGREVFRGPAPDIAAGLGQPANLLTGWPERGVVPQDLQTAAEQAFARALGRAGDEVFSKVLFGGDDDAGNAYVLLQAWLAGDDAYTFGYTVRPDGEAVPFLGPKTDPQAPVLALLVPAAPGQSTDTLVVVPQPRTGQVLYGEARTEPRPVGEDQSFDGVVLVDRAPDATGDRLVLLDGNGDLDAPTFDGQVADLLCGLRGCG